MSDKRGGAPRARLVDMEVQEVSLVDRAANKRKFLVVKRSEGMAQEANADAGEGTSDTEAGEHDGEDHAEGEGSPLEVAATALEGLTGAMTRLQSAATDTQCAELGNVIQELRDAADALESIGASDDTEPEEDEVEDHSGSTDALRAGGDLAVLVGAMTDLVAELRASRTGQPAAKAARRGAQQQDGEEDGDDAGTQRPSARPGTKRKSGGKPAADENALEQDVRALRSELKAFTGALQEQARRLSKLEKRAATPASRPPGERPSSPSRGSDEGAWPLDLNASQRR
jgi:hypothetical protein